MNASRRNALIWIPIAILAVLLIAGYAYAQSQKPKLELGVGYGARVACGCRYIEGRPLDSCYKDFEPGMEVIHLADDPHTKTVTASVPLLASRSVRFDAELGCQPAPYKD
ncbi:hypothetical protein EAH79_00485 [Sphingomonas koreensis]|nr:hypothetical protein EAH87_12525 [Sphingomonas koreensis]TPG42422.1 hypothetical protein EAH79_00485 [Sphingomonas koreensis]